MLVAIVSILPSVCPASEDWFDKGNAYFDAHKYAEAVSAYTKALEKVSAKPFLDEFIALNYDDFLNKRSILHRDYPFFKWSNQCI